eukprot:GHRR01009833.1.p1 GENE.GHRR01009833.1~~GHRR01009833.1.p1  ORF type:complete len:188 (+),score=34.05 GHRR01009833.1:2389-2952(+)
MAHGLGLHVARPQLLHHACKNHLHSCKVSHIDLLIMATLHLNNNILRMSQRFVFYAGCSSKLAEDMLVHTLICVCCMQVNEFVKRVRAFRIHLLILGHIRKQMPAMFGKDKAQRKMLDKLPEVFYQVQREHHLPAGDFPDVNRFRNILSAFDFANFSKLSKSMVKQIDDVLSIDVPNLVRAFDNPYQ